jgi:hypothetical protein
MDRRKFLNKAGLGSVALASLPALQHALAASASADGGADHVRWDIISLTGGAPPGPINSGGYADARAPDNTFIRLTGSGTFVAPQGGNRGSSAVTGGGTWETFSGTPSPATSTARGTFRVTELASWEFANFQAPPPAFIDNIDEGRAANGAAVLNIAFSDGTQGVLTVGCHGPAAPPGIFEGIATTKGYKTYYDVQPPQFGVDANRTIFHVRR